MVNFMTDVYHDEDADLSVLDDQTIGIIGYGNQGRSQALNLRDSGVDVIVGNIEDESLERAIEDGFDTYSIQDAVVEADIISVLIPDEVQQEIFDTDIKPGLETGDTLLFSHGYNVYYNSLDIPDDVDVIMVAPKMIGPVVRELFEKGDGVPAEVAVDQNITGDAMDQALAYAKGIGATRSGALESSFEQETVLDLFCEQMMAGGSLATTMAAFEVLTSKGYDPVTVAFNLYLSGEAIEESRLRAQEGLINQLENHSPTSQYGQLTRGMAMANEALYETYRDNIEDIESGEFAKEWELEQAADYPVFERQWEQIRDHELTDVEEKAHELLDLSFE